MISQNGQTHFKNLTAFAFTERFVECVRLFWVIMPKSVKVGILQNYFTEKAKWNQVT